MPLKKKKKSYSCRQDKSTGSATFCRMYCPQKQHKNVFADLLSVHNIVKDKVRSCPRSTNGSMDHPTSRTALHTTCVSGTQSKTAKGCNSLVIQNTKTKHVLASFYTTCTSSDKEQRDGKQKLACSCLLK